MSIWTEIKLLEEFSLGYSKSIRQAYTEFGRYEVDRLRLKGLIEYKDEHWILSDRGIDKLVKHRAAVKQYVDMHKSLFC